MEVIKRIELRNYQTTLYQDHSSLEERWETERKKKSLSKIPVNMIDDQDEIDYDVRYVELSNTGRRGTKWTFKEDFRDEKKYLENYQRALSSRDCEKYVEGEADVVDMEKIVNEFAMLRNQWLGIIKALDIKQWQLSNIIKLRTAGLEDITL